MVLLFKEGNNGYFLLQTQFTIPGTGSTCFCPFYKFLFNKGKFIKFLFAVPYIFRQHGAIGTVNLMNCDYYYHLLKGEGVIVTVGNSILMKNNY